MSTLSWLSSAPSNSKPCMTVRSAHAAEAASGADTSSGTRTKLAPAGNTWKSAQPAMSFEGCAVPYGVVCGQSDVWRVTVQ